MKHVINLGAGVQSSTMALMSACGEITPMPDFAIFADTQAEPAAVYRWLDWLESELPFPVYRVTAGSLRDSATTEKTSSLTGRSFPKTAIPMFTLNSDGSTGTIPHRTCTRDFKIRPIHKDIRHRCYVPRGQKTPIVTQWLGISLDEVVRAKPSRESWSVHRFPLLENRFTRLLCLDWMKNNGFPEPPRSACVFCPYHSQSEWRHLKADDPQSFADAVTFEREVQEIRSSSSSSSTPFLHRSHKMLDTIDFSSDVDKGQLLLWQDECEGMCGV